MTTYRETRAKEIEDALILVARNNAYEPIEKAIQPSKYIADLQISKEVELLSNLGSYVEQNVDRPQDLIDLIQQLIKERE